MGFLDKLKGTAKEVQEKAKVVKDKAVETIDEKSPQIKGGISKAGEFVDKKTKHKYSDKIAKGTQQAKAAVDKIDKSDDAAKQTPPTPPPPPPSTQADEPPSPPPASTL